MSWKHLLCLLILLVGCAKRIPECPPHPNIGDVVQIPGDAEGRVVGGPVYNGEIWLMRVLYFDKRSSQILPWKKERTEWFAIESLTEVNSGSTININD